MLRLLLALIFCVIGLFQSDAMSCVVTPMTVPNSGFHSVNDKASTTSFTPVAKVTDGERYTIVHDYLGTPTQAYDSKGNLVWEMLLDVYGEVMESRGDRSLVPFRYQGQYEDWETGLYYNRFRYYSPEMGMYISSDPIGLAGNNPTLYGYVQDLNTWFDVLGLFPFYRGAKEAQSPSFEPRPPVYDSRGKQIGGDYKINRTTGLVQPTHGVSVFDNPQSIREKGFTPYELDESSISDKLIIKQRGKDPKHFEIMPAYEMSEVEYKTELRKIRCK